MNNDVWDGAGRHIWVHEVGTRDGPQVEQAFVPTDDKTSRSSKRP